MQRGSQNDGKCHISPQHYKAKDRAKYYEQPKNVILTQLYVPPPRDGAQIDGNVCITPEVMAKYSLPSDPLITPLDGSIPESLVKEHMITYRNLSGLAAINFALAMCEIEEQQNMRRLSMMTPQGALERGNALMRAPRFSQLLKLQETSSAQRTAFPKSKSSEVMANILENEVESMIKALPPRESAGARKAPEQLEQEGKSLLMKLISGRTIACLDAPTSSPIASSSRLRSGPTKVEYRIE